MLERQDPCQTEMPFRYFYSHSTWHSMADGPQSFDTLLQQLLATRSRKKQIGLLQQLAKDYSRSPELLRVLKKIAIAKGGNRLALLFVSRLPVPVPNEVSLIAISLIARKESPLAARLSAAARILASLPDRRDVVLPVVKAIQAGTGRTRGLETLIKLQSRVEKSDALDRLIEETEIRVQLRCPKCHEKMSRPDLIKHLWYDHRLIFDHGRAREPSALMEQAVGDAVNPASPETIDQLYLLGGQLYNSIDPTQIHQALLSRSIASPEELEPLLKSAADAGAGVCPACFAAMKNPLAALPLPLFFQEGRLLGEGYRIEVDRQSYTISRPGRNAERFVDSRARLGPRELGIRVGCGIAGLAAAFALVVPRRMLNPLAPAFLGSILAVTAYAIIRHFRQTTGNRNDRAIDAAWEDLVPNIGRSHTAVRFLTRLCRSSIGRGDYELRSSRVLELVESAAELSDKRGPYIQLLAAVRVLQSQDMAMIGREWVSELVRLFEPFFRCELPAEYAETAADCLLHCDPFHDSDAARLRVILTGAAFEAGLVPQDLVELGEYLPQFARLLAGNEEWFRFLYEVHCLRGSRPWDAVGSTETVFEYARNSPGASGKILVNYPDTLLISRFDPPFDRELGLVLIGKRGVTVMERTVSDAQAAVAIKNTRNGTSVLQFGPHPIAVKRRLSEKVARMLQAWLQFREERLLPGLEKSRARRSDRMRQLLFRLAVDCPLCGTRSILRQGELGVPIGSN